MKYLKQATYQDFLDINDIREEQSESLVAFENVPGKWKNFNFFLRCTAEKNGCFACKTPEGDVLAVQGYMHLFADTYETWMLVNKDTLEIAKKNPMLPLKSAKEFVSLLPKGRHQTTVRTDFPDAINFIERIGYKIEGLLKHYINDVDVYLYAIVKE